MESSVECTVFVNNMWPIGCCPFYCSLCSHYVVFCMLSPCFAVWLVVSFLENLAEKKRAR